MKKRGFIFSLDSFFAIILFVVVLVTIYTFFIRFSPSEQQYYISEDLLNLYSNIKIEDLDLNKYPNINSLIENNKLNDTSISIVEIVSTLKINSEVYNDIDYITSAESIITDLSQGLFTEEYDFSLYLGNTKVYGEEPLDIVNLLARQRLVIGEKKLEGI